MLKFRLHTYCTYNKEILLKSDFSIRRRKNVLFALLEKTFFVDIVFRIIYCLITNVLRVLRTNMNVSYAKKLLFPKKLTLFILNLFFFVNLPGCTNQPFVISNDLELLTVA